MNWGFMGFVLWVVVWIGTAFAISTKKDSLALSLGGGFLISLLVLFGVAAATGNLREKDPPAPQQVAVKQSPEELRRKAEAEKARAQAEKEARERAKAAEEAKCFEDVVCWSGRHYVDAISAAQPLIERRAQYQFKWTDGVVEKKFSKVMWLNKQEHTLRYFGDKVMFQNGFGAFQNMTYMVDFDTDTKTVLAVNVAPGRL